MLYIHANRLANTVEGAGATRQDTHYIFDVMKNQYRSRARPVQRVTETITSVSWNKLSPADTCDCGVCLAESSVT
jgi:hypothetical protein